MVRCIVKILAFTDRADRVVRPYAPTSEPIRLLNGRDTPFRCAPQRGSSALTGGVAPVTFTARRGEGPPALRRVTPYLLRASVWGVGAAAPTNRYGRIP